MIVLDQAQNWMNCSTYCFAKNWTIKEADMGLAQMCLKNENIFFGPSCIRPNIAIFKWRQNDVQVTNAAAAAVHF